MSTSNRKTRYIIPFFLFVVGGYIAYEMIARVTEGMAPTGILAPIMATPDLGTDIVVIMGIGMPLLAIEYLLITIPGAAVILFITRIYKAPSYELNIMNIGREFGALRMVKRSVAPALFSLAFAGTFINLVKIYAFGTPEPTVPPGYESLFEPVVTLMGALIFMFISLALFTPTWVLNDTGVVTHIKPEIMKSRRCPDTQGVGRWMSNVLGGYGVIAYPLYAFMAHFYTPLILPLLDGTGLISWQQTIFLGIQALLYTLVLPFILMAFIMPVVILNEALLGRMTGRVGRLARRLGSKVVRKEVIQVDKRTSAGFKEEEEKPNLPPDTMLEKQIVSSAKTTKRTTKKPEKEKKKEKKKK